MRFWKWTLSTTVFLAVLAGCATASHTTASNTTASAARGHQAGIHAVTATKPTTRAHHFSPFTASGKLRVAAAKRDAGRCWETSLAAPGKTAYRCLSGNTILDPCFVSSARTGTATCVGDPWSRAIVLTLTKKLPKPDVVAPNRPWAIRLSNGAHCVAATGTAAFVHGQNLDYICSNGAAAGLLNPNAHRVVAAYARPTAATFTRVAVAGLWRT